MKTIAPYPYDSIRFHYDPESFASLFDSDLGQAMWDFLTRPEIVLAMVTAVRVGAAPVSAISTELLDEFSSGNMGVDPRTRLIDGLIARFSRGRHVTLDQVKRMMGHMIRQILGQVGLVVRTKNSPANDPAGIFTTSARYSFLDVGRTP